MQIWVYPNFQYIMSIFAQKVLTVPMPMHVHPIFDPLYLKMLNANDALRILLKVEDLV